MNVFYVESAERAVREFLKAWMAGDWAACARFTTHTFRDQYKEALVKVKGKLPYRISPERILKDMLAPRTLRDFVVIDVTTFGRDTTGVIAVVDERLAEERGQVVYMANAMVRLFESARWAKSGEWHLHAINLVCESGVRQSAPDGTWGVVPHSIRRVDSMSGAIEGKT